MRVRITDRPPRQAGGDGPVHAGRLHDDERGHCRRFVATQVVVGLEERPDGTPTCRRSPASAALTVVSSSCSMTVNVGSAPPPVASSACPLASGTRTWNSRWWAASTTERSWHGRRDVAAGRTGRIAVRDARRPRARLRSRVRDRRLLRRAGVPERVEHRGQPDRAADQPAPGDRDRRDHGNGRASSRAAAVGRDGGRGDGVRASPRSTMPCRSER